MKRSLPQVKRKSNAVFLSVLCFAVYMVSYIGRLNYSAALTEMTVTGILSKTRGEGRLPLHTSCVTGQDSL